MNRTEKALLGNRKLVIEIDSDHENSTETVKSFILDDKGAVEADSVRITCTCNGKSVTRTCSRDGYCDCSGDTPKVVCT